MKRYLAQIRHDLTIEYRSWPQVLALCLFILVIAFIIFRTRPEMSRPAFNFLFWIFLLILSVNVAIRSAGNDRGNSKMMQYTLAPPEVLLTSRLIFNMIYLLIISLLFYVAMLFLYFPSLSFNYDYIILILIGAVAIGSITGLISAISRHVQNQNTSLSVLAIPLLIPVVLLLHNLGANVLLGNPMEMGKIAALFGISLVSIALSITLFPYLWRE